MEIVVGVRNLVDKRCGLSNYVTKEVYDKVVSILTSVFEGGGQAPKQIIIRNEEVVLEWRVDLDVKAKIYVAKRHPYSVSKNAEARRGYSRLKGIRWVDLVVEWNCIPCIWVIQDDGLDGVVQYRVSVG